MMLENFEIEKRIELQRNELNKIKFDFSFNLKPALTALTHCPLTPELLKNTQHEINLFLQRNYLPIHVFVSILNGDMVVMGVDLVSELVWEQIQSNR